MQGQVIQGQGIQEQAIQGQPIQGQPIQGHAVKVETNVHAPVALDLSELGNDGSTPMRYTLQVSAPFSSKHITVLSASNVFFLYDLFKYYRVLYDISVLKLLPVITLQTFVSLEMVVNLNGGRWMTHMSHR